MDHAYALDLLWEGDTGRGTADYAGYERRFRISIAGKPDLTGSADPAFRGDAALHNPEDLLLAAVASCHMLTYLALCARHGIAVVRYSDAARGTLALAAAGGGGRFAEIVLRPRVGIASGDHSLALALHDRAHELCFIARSCAFPIRHEPSIED